MREWLLELSVHERWEWFAFAGVMFALGWGAHLAFSALGWGL